MKENNITKEEITMDSNKKVRKAVLPAYINILERLKREAEEELREYQRKQS